MKIDKNDDTMRHIMEWAFCVLLELQSMACVSEMFKRFFFVTRKRFFPRIFLPHVKQTQKFLHRNLSSVQCVPKEEKINLTSACWIKAIKNFFGASRASFLAPYLDSIRFQSSISFLIATFPLSISLKKNYVPLSFRTNLFLIKERKREAHESTLDGGISRI